MKTYRRTTRSLRPEEERLWRSVTSVVPPLKEESKQYALPIARRTRARGDNSSLEEDWSAIASEQKSLFRRRKGTKLFIDARLDLHGLNQADAHAALKAFLLRESLMGSSVVLVITGVGEKHDVGGEKKFGALKTNVPMWLATFGQYVSKVNEAHVRDGGAGALYVHLKKGKKRVL